MSSYNNLVQRVEIHYSPSDFGGGSRFGSVQRPRLNEATFAAQPSETEQHLQRAHDLLARIRQAVHTDH